MIQRQHGQAIEIHSLVLLVRELPTPGNFQWFFDRTHGDSVLTQTRPVCILSHLVI